MSHESPPLLAAFFYFHVSLLLKIVILIKLQFSNKKWKKLSLDMAIQTCNPRTEEAEDVRELRSLLVYTKKTLSQKTKPKGKYYTNIFIWNVWKLVSKKVRQMRNMNNSLHFSVPWFPYPQNENVDLSDSKLLPLPPCLSRAGM